MTYTLYGAPVSLYTGKVRSYMRTQGIDFVEVAPGSERYLQHIVPAVGSSLALRPQTAASFRTAQT